MYELNAIKIETIKIEINFRKMEIEISVCHFHSILLDKNITEIFEERN